MGKDTVVIPIPPQNDSEGTTIEPHEIPVKNPEVIVRILPQQIKIDEINQSLLAIIDSIFADPSFLTRIARYWGELPAWERIVAGVAISGSLFVIGAIAHFGLLITLSALTAFGYFGGNFILDDHYIVMNKAKERLKEAILPLAKMLETIILALDQEITKFNEENKALSATVHDLNLQVTEIQATVFSLSETCRSHEEANRAMSLQLGALKNSCTALEAVNERIAKREAEITLVKDALEKENKQIKLVCTALQGAVASITESTVADGEQRKAAQEKLSKFLGEKETTFDSLCQRICTSEEKLVSTQRELELVKAQLTACNEKYSTLLNRQDAQIHRLEGLGAAAVTVELQKPNKHARSASFSFFPCGLDTSKVTLLETTAPNLVI